MEEIVGAKTTPRGFEPLRAEPNGFLVHLLNHSDTVSYVTCEKLTVETRNTCVAVCEKIAAMSVRER
jgi:hypothetical protein